MNNLTIKDELTEFLLYTTKESDVKVEIEKLESLLLNTVDKIQIVEGS